MLDFQSPIVIEFRASWIFLASSFSATIFPLLSNLNSEFFFCSYTFGSMPTISSIKSWLVPKPLRSFSIPLNTSIVFLPPNSLSRALREAPQPSVTLIWFILTSLNFFTKSSNGEDCTLFPSSMVFLIGTFVASAEVSVTV